MRVTLKTIATLTLLLWPFAGRGQTTMRTVGYASYYHDNLHGHRMANGDRYHRDSMTCAHTKFPMGTLLRVHNTRTGQEVVVEVTDRGPFSKVYVIDLSKRAARELGILGAKRTEVVLTPVGDIHIPFRIAKVREEPSPFEIEPTIPYINLYEDFNTLRPVWVATEER